MSRQLGLWMVGLVLVTAAAVGLVSYLSIENSLSAGEVEELRGDVRLVAARLELAMDGARGDIATFSELPSVEDMIRTAAGDSAEAAHARSRVTGYITALLAAKPQYAKLRVVNARGHELLRVDRSGAGGSIRAAAAADLSDTSGRDFMAASTMTMGDIFVSRPDLNVENGAIEPPRVPTVRLAMPLFDERGRRFGIVVLHVDLRPAFAEVRAAGSSPTRLHVVNEAGDYLLHPDPAMEFAFQSGTPRRVQDRFPGLARVLREHTAIAQLIDDDTGQPVALAVGPARLAGGPYVFVVATVPQADLVAPARVVRNTALLAGMAAALSAALLALWLARSLTTPLKQMTAAASAFVPGSAMSLPTQSSGEIGVLARAFERMALDVSRKTAALRDEIASHLRTEDQRAALAERDRLMSAAVQSSNDAIVTATLDSTITSWNPAAERTYGYKAEEVIGKNGGFLVPPDIERLKLEIYARIRRGEAIEPFETVLLRQDGKRINISFSPSPIRDDFGTVVGVCITSRDITEAQATRERLKHAEKLDAVGQLTGGVAHDFNNLLTVIQGSAELLADGVADRPALADLVQTVDTAADRGATLTRQLLAFARRQPLDPRRTDVNALVEETVRLLKPTLGEHIEMATSLERDAWMALVDPAQLSTALINLAVNARDAMVSGGRLTLETGNVILDESYAAQHAEVTPGRYVMIAVSDTGTGIAPEILGRIFEPFYTTKEAGKGTGLGLSMVYGFAKQSNGHIKVYSEVGHGTTIKLYLPRSADDDAAMPDGTATTDLPRGNERILVVEDDDLVRRHVVTLLRALGYATITASDGREALSMIERVDEVKFDLLFTDVIMPGGMNGGQLAEHAIFLRPGLRVLYTSGYTENAVVHHGRLQAGIVLLNKPYRRADLARKIREVLDAPGA